MASIAWQLVACLLVADLLTGFAHWFEDTYGLPSWPIIGKLVIEPNIEHHRNPTFMVTMGSLVDRNLQSLIAAAAVIGGCWLAGWLPWQLCAVAVFASLGNEVHAWAHGGGNAATRMLQEMAIVTTPQHHKRHHRPPYDRAFCVLTNVVNPVADRLRLWRGLEWCGSIVGVHPKRMSAERGYL